MKTKKIFINENKSISNIKDVKKIILNENYEKKKIFFNEKIPNFSTILKYKQNIYAMKKLLNKTNIYDIKTKKKFIK